VLLGLLAASHVHAEGSVVDYIEPKYANKMGAAWSFGATDKAMLIRVGSMIVDSLEKHYGKRSAAPRPSRPGSGPEARGRADQPRGPPITGSTMPLT